MNIGSVIVTGANRGIGLEFIKQLVSLPKPPNHVFATCRNPDKAEELQNIAKSHANLHLITLDVKDYSKFPFVRKEIEQVVGDNGLNLLINNAGVCFRDSLTDVTRENMVENFEVNTVSPLLLCKELLPLLQKAASKSNINTLSCTRAAIINITSKMGSIDDNTSGGCYPYRVSKVALNMVTKSLAVDLKPQGILALALHPGWVITDMGGAGLITTETSVGKMLNTMAKATDEDGGLMLNYDGKRIAW